MAKTIEQKVSFNVSPNRLFNIYMDAKLHGAAINSSVIIKKKTGASFSAFNGYVRGKNLLIVPNRLIVQSWRGKEWEKNDADSILVLSFEKARHGALLHMVHSNVPDHIAAKIKKGWNEYYWKPWKRYLKERR